MPEVDELVEHYCLDCHNFDAQEADLSLDLREFFFGEFKTAVCEDVIRKLCHRQMPPADAELPDEQMYLSVALMLEKQRDAAATTEPNPGRSQTFAS